MSVECTYRRMTAGGTTHEHIAGLGWKQGQNQGYSTREQMVDYIEKNGTEAVFCPDLRGGPSAWVHVFTRGGSKYLQTVADGRPTNNLLSLPLG